MTPWRFIHRGLATLGALAVPSGLHFLGVTAVERRLLSGQLIRVRTGSALTKGIWNEPTFEPAVREAIARFCREGMAVVDIGANIGYYTIQMASLVGPRGRVLAIEPNPVMVKELQANLSLNGLTNVDIMRSAVGAVDGVAQFYFPTAGHEAHGSLRPNSTFDTASQGEVPLARLDSVIHRLNIESVGLIKMDIEGAELLALRGAEETLKRSKPTVIFEASEQLTAAFDYSVIDTLKYLDGLGYRLTELEYGNWLATCP